MLKYRRDSLPVIHTKGQGRFEKALLACTSMHQVGVKTLGWGHPNLTNLLLKRHVNLGSDLHILA